MRPASEPQLHGRRPISEPAANDRQHAAAMYDWQSTNTTPSTDGAKSETYSTLQPPYNCKNAPYETIDELRLVYGLNMDILYGEDANLNGALDPNENDGMKAAALRQPGWHPGPRRVRIRHHLEPRNNHRHQRHHAHCSHQYDRLAAALQTNFNLTQLFAPPPVLPRPPASWIFICNARRPAWPIPEFQKVEPY
jgi:hypothetical protein